MKFNLELHWFQKLKVCITVRPPGSFWFEFEIWIAKTLKIPFDQFVEVHRETIRYEPIYDVRSTQSNLPIDTNGDP